MAFTKPEWLINKQKEEYNLKYIKYDNGNEIHVSKLADKSVTSEMRSQMRMNSWAQDDLPPKLTDEALIEMARYYINHCKPAKFPCVTYDEATIHKILPEFIKRLESK